MGKRRKGNRHEEMVCNYYAGDYEVWMPSWGGRGHGRYRSTDPFNAFDLIATSKEEMIYIQVKSESAFRNRAIKKMLAVPMPPNVLKEYWAFWTDDEIRVRRYKRNKMIEEYKVSPITLERLDEEET